MEHEEPVVPGAGYQYSAANNHSPDNFCHLLPEWAFLPPFVGETRLHFQP